MAPFTHFRWQVKAFFRTACTVKKKKTERFRINVDRASENSEQIIRRKRKKEEKKRKIFIGGNVDAQIHAPTKNYERETISQPTKAQQPTSKSDSSKQDARNIVNGTFLNFKQEALDLQDALQNVFLTLTIREETSVKNALHGSNSEEVLVMHESSNIEITRRVFQCLEPGGRLNDEVINLYLELLKERGEREPMKFLKCHFFNTFFYVKLTKAGKYDYKAVRRWTRHEKLGYNLLECDSILVPIHNFDQDHWCLAIINIKENKIQYFDSLNGRDHDTFVFNALAQYIKDEANDKCGKDLDLNKWKREYVENLPKQRNNYDCGMFMIKYADFHSRGMPLSFTQVDIPYFRKRIAKEILRLRVE